MRHLFLILLGLFIGIFGTVMAISAWQSGAGPNVQRGAMAVLAHHSAALRADLEAGRCAAATVLPHIEAMQAVAAHLEPMFLPTGDDASFERESRAFRDVLAAARGIGSDDCSAVRPVVGDVNAQCRSCHQIFR
ncbi:hypothetical protein [Coralloluteibacterium thermophilus]|uniref:Cytochrome C n=1 Tax=Coralloluteibacterium thermophilum TaxID=2707049 RepID=A0ABV9NI97_9GAMM